METTLVRENSAVHHKLKSLFHKSSCALCPTIPAVTTYKEEESPEHSQKDSSVREITDRKTGLNDPYGKRLQCET